MLIHLLGDSHTNVFRGLKPPFQIHPNTPTCAHNLWRKGALLGDIAGIDINDKIIFVFGEIDCRTHIYYRFLKLKREIPISILVDNTVNNYRLFLEQVKQVFAVYNVLPAGTWQGPEINWKGISTPVQVRSIIHSEFHYKINEMCRRHNFKVIDMWPDILGDDGFTKKELKCDEVHLGDGALPLILPRISAVFPELKEEIMKANA
jgi:hypothetical protein